MSFHVRWPDGSTQRCYSPSTVVGEHLRPGEAYALGEFLQRSRTALGAASDRVAARYGFACTSAAAQLADIEQRAAAFSGDPGASVLVERFGA